MKISKLSILILVLIVGITGCKKKEDDEIPVITTEEAGAIFVTVTYSGQTVSGATVTTNPATEEVTTNAMGNVLIRDVSDGTYQIVATKDGLGSGSGAVDVDQGGLGEVTVFLEPGVYEGPMVDITLVSSQNTYVGYTVSLEAVVTDSIDASEDIDFEWSTDLDGVISTQGANSNGYASIEHVFETDGERTLTVSVTNSEGNTDSDQVMINIMALPDPVVLEPIEVVDYTMHLTWSQAETEEFSVYKVHREDLFGSEEIEIIYDINTTSFIDHDVEIGIEYNYQIELSIGGTAEIMSNAETGLFEGEYIDIGTNLEMLRHDPNNPMIYGLDTDNNALVFINTEQNQVVNTIPLGLTPTDMDFSLDNQLIYIAKGGSTEITIIDIASQSVQSTLDVEIGTGVWEGPPHTLAVMANGLLAFAGADDSNRIQLVETTSGNNVFTSSESPHEPYVVANSDGTKLFVGESDVSSCELLQYELIDSELTLQETSYYFSFTDKNVFLTDNDDFVFYAKRKFLASSLPSIAGTFGDEIYAINADGSLALGEEEAYNGFNYSTVSNLPLSTKVSVFGNDNYTAYLFQEETNRLYKVTIE